MIGLARTVVVVAGLIAVIACGGTKLSGTWQDLNMIGVPLKKVVVLTLAKDKIMRRVAEDEFVKSLPKNTQGIQSYNLIPDDELEDEAKVRARLEKANVDGAAVLRLVGSDIQVTYNPGHHHVLLLGILRLGLSHGVRHELRDVGGKSCGSRPPSIL